MAPSEESTTFPKNGARRALLGIKLLELCLCICLIGLIDEPSTHSNIRVFISPRVVSLCYVTFGALLIYSAIYLLTAMVGDINSWRAGALWSFVGFCLFVAATILLFIDWGKTKDRNYWQPNMHRLDLVVSAASVSLVTALVFAVDILVTIRYGIQGDLE